MNAVAAGDWLPLLGNPNRFALVGIELHLPLFFPKILADGGLPGGWRGLAVS